MTSLTAPIRTLADLPGVDAITAELVCLHAGVASPADVKLTCRTIAITASTPGVFAAAIPVAAAPVIATRSDFSPTGFRVVGGGPQVADAIAAGATKIDAWIF